MDQNSLKFHNNEVKRFRTSGSDESEQEIEAEKGEFGRGVGFGDVIEEAQVGEEGYGEELGGDALGVESGRPWGRRIQNPPEITRKNEPSATAAPPSDPLGPPGEARARTARWPNPPDPCNPDPAVLREQWQYATRRFSRWSARAWGTAFLAGLSLFAAGWMVKGANPVLDPPAAAADRTPSTASSDRP
ncbi:hypothetical protein ZIOFF_002046 [Zingiber officinale]|uniref:Uncharacterized protein n=1 Tax=Zingiber officinale TaxID=94328 RepID=A0A8J5I6T7_ZINOF|nr:hypothetical protein ZIOFF_002046 [Zingiber officinale]